MEWTRGHTIGQGSTATVSVATTRGGVPGDMFAVKSSELSKSAMLQREEKIMSCLDHPRIVCYKGHDITMENMKLMFNIKMEYLPGGTLSDAIKKSGGPLEESAIGYYTRQIVEGLDYLHSIGLVHCDIKGQNILLRQSKAKMPSGRNSAGTRVTNCIQSSAKIADFGCAKWLNPAASMLPMGGTPLFMAPEVARGENQGCPADIWALGCTILEMAVGYVPWSNAINAASLLYRIAFSEDYSPEIPQFLSHQAKDFLSKCLIRDPKKRWSAPQLLKHEFLNELPCFSRVENQDLCRSSPTSILDQGIWNSVEKTEDLIGCVLPESTSNSQAARQRLGLLSFNSGQPNWKNDENWITIRCNRQEKLEAERSRVDEKWRDLNVNVNFTCIGENVCEKSCKRQRPVNTDLHFRRHEKKQKLI